MVDDTSGYLAQFRDEIVERLQSLNGALLQLEAGPYDSELLNTAMREAHTVKGLASVVGLDHARDLSHRLEDVITAFQAGRCALDAEAFDVCFLTMDCMGASLDGTVPEDAIMEVVRRTEALLARPVPEEPPVLEEPPLPGEPPLPAARPRAAGPTPPDPYRDRRGVVNPHPAELLKITVEELNQLSEFADFLASHQQQEADTIQLLRPIARSIAGIGTEMETLAAQPESLSAPDRAKLLELRTRCREIKHELDSFASARETTSLEAGAQVESFRRAVYDLRFVPIESLFNALPRTVRDLAHAEQKEVGLRLVGGETRLDRRVLEQVRAPVIQLLRNAISHGIEKPEVREALGKDRTGAVTVEAYRNGDRVAIEVCDDGAGIDPPTLRRVARSKGMPERSADKQSDADLIGLIFRSGFSTRPEADGVSGRGMGLDLVRSRIAALNGAIWVVSEPNRGTAFVMELPAGEKAAHGE